MGAIFLIVLVLWVICFITSVYVDSLKKNKTQKSFRVYKRVLSGFLVCVGFVVWLVSLDSLLTNRGIICTIVSNVIMLIAIILLFINVNKRDVYYN